MKRRYLSEVQILDAIDHTRHEIRRLMERAESLELSASLLCRIAQEAQNAKAKREEAKGCRQKAELILNRSLPKLGQKLAEFRTRPLPNMEPGPEGVPFK